MKVSTANTIRYVDESQCRKHNPVGMECLWTVTTKIWLPAPEERNVPSDT